MRGGAAQAVVCGIRQHRNAAMQAPQPQKQQQCYGLIEMMERLLGDAGMPGRHRQTDKPDAHTDTHPHDGFTDHCRTLLCMTETEVPCSSIIRPSLRVGLLWPGIDS